jgi:hypothetical protein
MAAQRVVQEILSGDFEALKNASETDWSKIVDATHGGMSIEAFADLAAEWLKTVKHPRFNRLYTPLVYQPMLEVMDYLRACVNMPTVRQTVCRTPRDVFRRADERSEKPPLDGD